MEHSCCTVEVDNKRVAASNQATVSKRVAAGNPCCSEEKLDRKKGIET